MINIKSIFNLLTFNKPRFTILHYADFVINDRAYFLITWQFKSAYKLKIKSLNYTSFKANGSAYVLIPGEINQIDLVISNLWKSKHRGIRLFRTAIATQLDYFPQKRFTELSKDMLYQPQPKFTTKNPLAKKLLVKTIIPFFKLNVKSLTKP